MSDKKETVAFDFGNSTECSATNVIGFGFDKGVDFNQSHKSNVSHALFVGGAQQAIVDISTAIDCFMPLLNKSKLTVEEKAELKIRADDVQSVIRDPSINTSFEDKLNHCIQPLKKLQASLNKVKDLGSDFIALKNTVMQILSQLGEIVPAS